MWSNKSTQDSHNDGNQHGALTKSIDNREILKHYKKSAPEKIPYYEGILLFLSRGSKVEKVI